MSDSREPASTNVPEWRRNAIPSGNSLSTRQFAERPKVTARWKDHRFIGENLSEVQARSPWEQPTGPTPEVSLESLGSDIWFLISSSVPKPTLLSICQTSPALYAQVIPVLYHTIDLSTNAPPDDNTVSFRYRRRTYERQYMFTRQISLKPEYGRYVRSLKWTLGVEHEHIRSTACCDHKDWAPPPSQANRIVWRSSEAIGKLFESLTQVVHLDIEWANRISGIIVVPEGGGLFPVVQKVNLGSISNASAILSGATNMPLSILKLGPYAVTRPDFSGLTRNATSSSSISTKPSPKKYPDLLHPYFLLRCKGLHTLSVITQHLETNSEVRDFYTSLATFLLTIRPHSFIFNLVGMNGRPLPQPMSARLRHKGDTRRRRHVEVAAAPGGSPVHISGLTAANVFPDNVQHFLLPLLEQGWDGLQKIEIRGVMKRLLVDVRRELSGSGVALAGDGWEEEWNSDENAIA